MQKKKDTSIALASLALRTVDEAAKIGGVSVGTLRTAMRAAGIEKRKPGPKTSQITLYGVALMKSGGLSAAQAAKKVGVNRATISRAAKRANRE